MSRLPGVTPFPPEFADRYRVRGYWEDVPQGRFYSEVFAAHGERLALVSGEERMSFAQMKARVDRLALHLLDLGVSQLDPHLVLADPRLARGHRCRDIHGAGQDMVGLGSIAVTAGEP